MAYINVDEVYILDNTGLQVDQVTDLPYTNAGLSESQQAQARANIGAGGTNPNLLDNPFFTVRQRGAGPFTSAGYSVDRWYKYSATGIVTPSNTGLGLNLNGNSSMELRYFAEVGGYPTSGNGKTFTVSMMTSDGNVYSGQFTMASSGLDANVYFSVNSANDVRVNFYTTATTLGIRFIFYTSLTVRAIKLELGSVSTLANDLPPDYATELAKCRYYFIRLYGHMAVCGAGYAGSATTAYILLPHAQLRTNPTLSVNGVGSYRLKGAANSLAVTGVSFNSTGESGTAVAVTVSGGLTTNEAYIFTGTSAGSYIDLSADL